MLWKLLSLQDGCPCLYPKEGLLAKALATRFRDTLWTDFNGHVLKDYKMSCCYPALLGHPYADRHHGTL